MGEILIIASIPFAVVFWVAAGIGQYRVWRRRRRDRRRGRPVKGKPGGLPT